MTRLIPCWSIPSYILFTMKFSTFLAAVLAGAVTASNDGLGKVDGKTCKKRWIESGRIQRDITTKG